MNEFIHMHFTDFLVFKIEKRDFNALCNGIIGILYLHRYYQLKTHR